MTVKEMKDFIENYPDHYIVAEIGEYGSTILLNKAYLIVRAPPKNISKEKND